MTMRQVLFVVLLLISGFVGFTGYCYAWVDWMEDVRMGVYKNDYMEAVGKTSAIGLYTYLAIRFVKSKVTL